MAQWITPPALEADGDDTVLGEINFGIESRMFVLAFRDTDDDDQILPTETSIPAYHRIVALNATELARYADSTEYLIALPRTAVELNQTHTRILIERQGVEIDTGLRLEANGQITGKLDITYPQMQIVIKVEYRDPPQYRRGTYYPAYSHIHYNRRLYRMYREVNAPYLAETGAPDSTIWEDIGTYVPQYPITDINGDVEENQRVFKVIINTQNSDVVDFITDPDLGEIRIGENFGESHNVKFETSTDDLMTFTLNSENRSKVGVEPVLQSDGTYHVLPKGLKIQPDGWLIGHPVGPTGLYKFKVTARNAAGLAKQQEFTLDVKAGYAERNFGAYLRMGGNAERRWYETIMSRPFNETPLYRGSDPNYGVVTVPKLLLKKNVDGTFNNTALDIDRSMKVAQTKLGSLDGVSVRTGNTRVRTALDARGEPVYDLVYKELLPPGANVAYDINPYNRVIQPLPNLERLKEQIYEVFGSQDLYVQDDMTRGIMQTDANGVTYFDDVPLYMSIPDPTQADPSFEFILPLAYVMPGEGETFIAKAIEHGQLADIFYNESITFTNMELIDWNKDRNNNRIVKFRCD